MKSDSALLLDVLKFADEFVPTDAVDWIDRVSEANAETVGEKFVALHRESFMKGIAEGWDSSTFKANMKEALGQEMNAGGHEAEIVTGMHTVFNRGRMDLYKEAGVKFFQFVAILDERTTEICTNLDGRILTPEDGDEFNPPLHYRCRSLLSPYFKKFAPDDPRLLDDAERIIARNETAKGFLGKVKEATAPAKADKPLKRPDLKRSDVSESRGESIRAKYYNTMKDVKGLSKPIVDAAANPLAYLDKAKDNKKVTEVQAELVRKLRDVKANREEKRWLAKLYSMFLNDLFADATLVSNQIDKDKKTKS